VARGKKVYDKRQDMAKRDAQREIERAMKSRTRQ
jgi:SsrA-binding protein